MNINENFSTELDLGRTSEALRRQIQCATRALEAIEQYQSLFTQPNVAGVRTVTNLGGSMEPTAVGADQSLWANAYAILQGSDGPKSTDEIAEIMRTSGVVTKSGNFSNTLDSIMCKRQDVFVRVSPRVWGVKTKTYPGTTTDPVKPVAATAKAKVAPFRPANGAGMGR